MEAPVGMGTTWTPFSISTPAVMFGCADVWMSEYDFFHGETTLDVNEH